MGSDESVKAVHNPESGFIERFEISGKNGQLVTSIYLAPNGAILGPNRRMPPAQIDHPTSGPLKWFNLLDEPVLSARQRRDAIVEGFFLFPANG